MWKQTFGFIIATIIPCIGFAITCTTVQEGDWAAADTWSCGRAPQDGDSLIIDHEVTVSGYNGEYIGIYIQVNNELKLAEGDTLDFDETSSVDVNEGAEVKADHEEAKIFVGETVWDSSQPAFEGPSFMNVGGMTNGAVLPVEFTDFKSESMLGHVKLVWTTGSEKNNDHFEIERSTNGVAYNFIGNELGAGTSSESTEYEYVDDNPIVGFAYYRLKQVDFDGSYDYSEVIGVELSENADGSCTVKIIPNPCSPKCDIQYTACESTATNFDLQVYDTNGRLIHSYLSASELSQGRSFRVNSTDFAMPGVYIVKAGQASERMVIK